MNRLLVAALLACAASRPALALTPSEVFEKVAPSVWAVRGLDAQERPFSYGSGVVIGPGRLVTNCHVLAKAKSIQVRRDNVAYDAKLEHADVERDLCTLSVSNLTAAAVQIVKLAQARVGQRVYAVGNPERLALTLSEGLISGLRSEDPGLPPLQTSAPISPGSSGGGLFDERGGLIGITTLAVLGRARIAQNLNFAVPAEWIAEVPERAKQQLAKRMESRVGAKPAVAVVVPAAEGLPPVGATWKYSFRNQRSRDSDRAFTIRVIGVDGSDVRESFAMENQAPTSIAVNAKEIRFTFRPITADSSIVELAPYFYSSDLGKSASPMQRPANYGSSSEWQIEPAVVDSDETVVPAGTYKTVRVEVSGKSTRLGLGPRNAPNELRPLRFSYTAWYAAEVNRYVKVRHQTWDRYNALIGDEVVQLLEYQAN